MSYLLSDITGRIRARLNDSVNAVYHDAILLPFAQDAADELQLELELNGALVLETISTAIVFPIAFTTLTYTSTPPLPSDMLEPQRLQERMNGTTGLYAPMIRREWEPNIVPTDALRYWVYRKNSILTVGATTARDVEIFYLRRALNISTISDQIDINNSQQFMINRIAGMAARYIGSNPTRADMLDEVAAKHLNTLTRIGAKARQGTRTRRRPFVLIGRRNWA